MRFDFPLAFLLLTVVPLMILYEIKRKWGFLGVKFSTTKTAAQIPLSLRQRLMFIPRVLRIFSLILLIAALARPQLGREKISDIRAGIAIFLVVDRSSSMGAEMQYENERLSRLEVVKRVFREFVIGNNRELEGRPNDLIGMISFARFSDTISPLTLSHGALDRFLDTVNLVERRSEDGTSIGDAIALAAARLKTADEELEQRSPDTGEHYTIKSKVMILLTDGENNAGKRTPLEAASLAKQWGIKVYTIGIGGEEDFITINTPFGVQKVPVASDIDESTLRRMAEETGGIYRKAGDALSLRTIYREIDRLERSEIEAVIFQDYQEAFLPFALAAFLLLVIELVLAATVFRRIP